MSEQAVIDYDPTDPERPFEGDDVVEVVESGSVEVVPVAEATAEALPDLAQSEMDLLRSRYKLAEQISKTEFVPGSLRGKPAAILACFMAGRELGLGPMASLQHVAVIDGRPSLSAELQVALARKAGHQIEGSATPTEATVTGTRGDTGETITVTWTLETALTAGLIDKIEEGKPIKRSSQGRPLPWERYPQSMLWARAVTQLCGMLFPDEMIGAVE